MGILDQVVGGLLGGGTSSPLAGMLMNMLQGNNQGNQAPEAGGGGLQGLVRSFEQAGLGNVVQSWISGGQNQPVSSDQLQSVLGHERVNDMASQSGMAPHDFLSQLSQHLPSAVDRITPNGRMPDNDSVSV